MLDSIEDISKYKVSLGSEDQFANIMKFVKNMELKDSKLCESYENELSKTFRKYLLKYFDANLTAKDANALIKLVKDYNEYLSNELNGEDSIEFKKRIFELCEDQDFSDSICMKITEYVFSNFCKRLYAKVIDSDLLSKKEWFETNMMSKLDSFKNAFCYYVYQTYFTEITGDINLDSTIVESQEYILLTTNIPDDTITPIDVMISSVIDNQGNNIEALKDTYINRNYIIIKESTTTLPEKFSASNIELKYANNGEPVILFDIVIPNDKYDFNNNTNGNSEIIILYKEFNQYYRNLLNLDMIDLLYNRPTFQKKLDSFQNKHDSNIFTCLRSYSDDPFYVYDVFGINKNIIGTRKLFKYQYGNPYLARKGQENDIIKYYIGDNYISDGYGGFKYQKVEIQNYLNIYQVVRNYYYRVLLNEAFINEDKYPFLEKFFLIFWSVERFMSSKIDNIRDIDTYDLTDIKNFLKSYGFKKLSDIIDDSVFYNSEEYAAAIVKNYKNLINYKGSKKVIDILEKIFSVEDTKLTIYKYMLVNVSGDYKFVKTDYVTDNIYRELKDNLTYAKDLDVVVEGDKDKYWDANNTPASLLHDLNVETVNTKYLLPELTVNIAKNYVKTRTALAFIEYIFDKYTEIGNDKNPNLMITSNYVSNSISYIKYLNIIKYELNEFLGYEENVWKNTINQEYNDDHRTFKINESILAEINDYFVLTDNDDTIRFSVDSRKISHFKHPEYIGEILTCFIPLIAIYNMNNSNINSIVKGLMEDKNTANNNSESLQECFIALLNDIENYVKGLIDGEYHKDALTEEEYQLIIVKLFELFMVNDNDHNCFKYIEDNDEDTVLPDFGDEDPAEVIVNLCAEFATAIDATFLLNVDNNEDNTLKFLKAAIEFFISYTAEIYQFIYAKSYDTQFESCLPRDSYALTLKISHMDTMYYDEELSMREIN